MKNLFNSIEIYRQRGKAKQIYICLSLSSTSNLKQQIINDINILTVPLSKDLKPAIKIFTNNLTMDYLNSTINTSTMDNSTMDNSTMDCLNSTYQ